MEVGPSAAPIMAIEAASLSSKPKRRAMLSVKKMPNCAAAPKSRSFGFERSGPKSIIAPMPIKRSRGKSSPLSSPMPISKSFESAPISVPCVSAPENGRFTSIAPKPIGSRSAGSISFLMAR